MTGLPADPAVAAAGRSAAPRHMAPAGTLAASNHPFASGTPR
jgi:hypothetical protein